MKEIRISESDILGTVEDSLRYFSGKRASDIGEYYRYAACEADRKLLMELIEESCAWVDYGLGPQGGGYSIKSDDIIFRMGTDDGTVDAVGIGGQRERTVYTLLRGLIVRRVVWRWLQLAGWKSEESVAREIGEQLSRLLSLVGGGGSGGVVTGPRYVPPV